MDEIEHINSLNDFQLVEYFQDGVVARATGDRFDNELYILIRRKLLANSDIKKLLPKWVSSKRTVEQFWTFIKGRYSTYQERREFLWEEFAPALNYLETKVVSPIDASIIFNEVHIHSEWKKALERKASDPEGAITIARTLVESVLKYILDEQKINYVDDGNLPKLYREVAKSLNLAPDQHNEEVFKQILGGANSVIHGLSTIRNRLGDAHGSRRNQVKPSERHSELVVSLAGAVAVFLFKTYDGKIIENNF
ncbi:MAG TPA: abortive infection family protein [Flavobacteriaceae bacterium]|nr:abortive infection family protein [Flavobacteriaceae bacterium]